MSHTDLLPFLDDSLVWGSLNKNQFAKQLAYFLKGKTISFSGIAIQSVTTDNADAIFQLSWPTDNSAGSLTNFMPMEFFLQKNGGTWHISGDRRIAMVEVRASKTTNLGSSASTPPTLALEANVEAIPGTVSGVTITGGPWSGDSLTPGSTNVMTFDNTMTMKSFSTYVIDPTGLAGGMPFTVTVTDNAAVDHSYVLPLNAVTTEAISVSGLTGSHIDNAHVGSAQTVTWTLPRTYPIGRVSLGGVAYSGTPGAYNKCDDQGATASFTSATSASIRIPATCNGQSTFQAEIYLQVYGINGELSMVYYTYTSDGSSGAWVNM